MNVKRTRTRRLLFFLFTVSLFSFTSALYAADLYVATTGSNTVGTGTAANP